MQLEKIKALAIHLDEPLTFVGFMDEDTRINVDSQQGRAKATPEEAFADAKKFADDERRTFLYYGVKACIGDDITVDSVDGFTGRT